MRTKKEPKHIDSDAVAAVLESIGCPRMARFVRDQGRIIAMENVEMLDWRRLYTETLARLHTYETPKHANEPVKYRSEWD